jgi:hypothetical protein
MVLPRDRVNRSGIARKIYLELSEEAELDFPEAFVRTLAELQRRLVHLTNRYELELFVSKISTFSP